MNNIFIGIFVIGVILLVFIAINVWASNAMKSDMMNMASNPSSYYYGNYGRQDKYKKASKVNQVDSMLRHIGALTMVFIIGVFVSSDNRLRDIWNGTGVYIDEIGTLMFKLLTMLAGLYFAFATFSKRTWLVFGVDDVINEFKVKNTLLRMGKYTLICNIIFWLKPITMSIGIYQLYFSIRLMSAFIFLEFMYFFIKLCWLLIECYLGNEMDMYFLDNLYGKLQFYSFEKVKEDKWESEIVRWQIRYLCNELIKYAKQIKIENINNIVFDSNLYRGDDKKDKKGERNRFLRRDSAIKYTIGLGTYFLFLIFAAILVYAKEYGIQKMTIIIFVAMGIGIFVLIFISGLKIEAFGTFLILLFYGRCSYEIKNEERDAQGKIIREYPFVWTGKYVKYIRTTKSIIMFFLIAPDDSKNIIASELQKKESETEVKIIIVILKFLSFINNTTNDMDYFRDIHIDDESLFDNKARAFCKDIAIRNMELSENEFDERFNCFMEDNNTKLKRVKIKLVFKISF